MSWYDACNCVCTCDSAVAVAAMLTSSTPETCVVRLVSVSDRLLPWVVSSDCTWPKPASSVAIAPAAPCSSCEMPAP